MVSVEDEVTRSVSTNCTLAQNSTRGVDRLPDMTCDVLMCGVVVLTGKQQQVMQKNERKRKRREGGWVRMISLAQNSTRGVDRLPGNDNDNDNENAVHKINVLSGKQ